MIRFSPCGARPVRAHIANRTQRAACLTILIASLSFETGCLDGSHGGESHRIPPSEVDSVVIAAARGEARAGLRLYEYHEFYTHDHPQAVRWLRVAAKTGDCEAATRLGTLLVRTEEEPVEGVFWLQFAAAQGGEEARAELRRVGQKAESRTFESPSR